MTEFSTLYRKYAPDVFRFALYLSGDRSDAEDITSETFVRAWTSPEPIRSATVKAYLLTIARNLFLRGLRAKRHRAALPEEAWGQISDPQPSPHMVAEGKAEFRAAVAGLQRLPETDRAALLMQAFEGMRYEEIAVALGIPLGTVKVKIHRARLTLAKVRGS
ncbi:MAG: RNA polymerase sigma factor [Thermoanaerobaculales bacterium]